MSQMIKHLELEYDGNDNETYTLLLNRVAQVELPLSEDGAIEITYAINSFIEQCYKPNNIITIKNDNDNIGLIVDIWDAKQDNCINSCCFYFEDFR